MSDEVNLIQAWFDQGQQTDDGGIPIPPRMDEAAIARVRTRLFGTAPAWTDADRDVLQAVVHRITNTESVSFSDGALRLAVLDIERRMYATQATNPRAANEPTPTGEPTWALDQARARIDELEAREVSDPPAEEPNESWEAWARREAPGDDSGECNEITLRVRFEMALRNLRHLRKESEEPTPTGEPTENWEARIVEVEAERDRQLEMSEQMARERVAEAAHRKRAEARAEQAERDRETYRREWSKKVAEAERAMCVAIEERDNARALVDTLRDQRARLLLAAAVPDPLPELETTFDGIAVEVKRPSTEQKAALYDHACAALADTFGGGLVLDPVSMAAHEYRDATEEIPGEDHGMFLDDEMYHPLNEIVATLAEWWREGAAADHELPAVGPLPEGARVAIQAAIAYVEGEGPCSFADDIEPYCSDNDCPYCKFARALDGEEDRLRAVLSRAKDGAASKVREPEPDTLYRADCRTGATPCLHGCHHGECYRAKDGA